MEVYQKEKSYKFYLSGYFSKYLQNLPITFINTAYKIIS